MTPLFEALARRIRAHGPISIAEYLAQALTAAGDGYYTGRDPLGAGGDFVTAPEVSQMFGELIGIWCLDLWQRMGEPALLRLVELGPGRGTLLADALRATARRGAFHEALQLHLVEVSPVLRDRQRTALAGFGLPLAWHASLDDVPDGPMLLVANEFFDALPIRQFQLGDRGWAERLVGLSPGGDRLTLGLGAPLPAAMFTGLPAAPVGAVLEVCLAGSRLAGTIARRLRRDGGAALLVDYGYEGPAFGDTLQAVRGHAYADVLAHPGEADLTAHVDFAALADAARREGGAVFGPVAQGAFLHALGIEHRAATLKRQASPPQAEAVDQALARLTGPAQMGELFRVMAMADPAGPPPAGF